MTNKEIRREIEKRIVLEGNVKDAFLKIVNDNAEIILKQTPTVKRKDSIYIANMALSFSIDAFKRAGIINKLYNVVLFGEKQTVVNDDIMEIAITNTLKLVK